MPTSENCSFPLPGVLVTSITKTKIAPCLGDCFAQHLMLRNCQAEVGKISAIISFKTSFINAVYFVTVHLLPKEHISGIMNAFIEILRDEHIEEDSIAFVIQKFSNMLKPSAAESNFLLESSDEWLDSLVDVLCSTKHIQPESFSMLLEMWKHGASYSIHCRCQSAVTVIKRKLLAIPECGMAERLVEVFQHILELELQQNDPEALCLIVRQVLLTDAEWTGWMKEATSCDLMAKEIMSGNYCHFVPITNNFKPVQLNSWAGLLNAAFMVSSIMVHNQDTFEKDRTEIIPNIFFASAVADLLQETNRNRTKVSLTI